LRLDTFITAGIVVLLALALFVSGPLAAIPVFATATNTINATTTTTTITNDYEGIDIILSEDGTGQIIAENGTKKASFNWTITSNDVVLFEDGKILLVEEVRGRERV
jgi:hypothetical protein